MLYQTQSEADDLETAIELLRVVRWVEADEATLRAAATGIAFLRRALADHRTRELFCFVIAG